MSKNLSFCDHVQSMWSVPDAKIKVETTHAQIPLKADFEKIILRHWAMKSLLAKKYIDFIDALLPIQSTNHTVNAWNGDRLLQAEIRIQDKKISVTAMVLKEAFFLINPKLAKSITATSNLINNRLSNDHINSTLFPYILLNPILYVDFLVIVEWHQLYQEIELYKSTTARALFPISHDNMVTAIANIRNTTLVRVEKNVIVNKIAYQVEFWSIPVWKSAKNFQRPNFIQKKIFIAQQYADAVSEHIAINPTDLIFDV